MIAFSSQAVAQVTPLPPGTRPPTREEVEQARPNRPAGADAPVVIDDEIERAPCPFDDPRFAEISFVLQQATFEGLDPVPADLVRPAYADKIGQTIRISDLCEIRDRAATLLRRAGYVAAVQIPDQRIEQGAARFQVLVARLVGIEFAGGKPEPLIARMLDKLRGPGPFNLTEAERYLLLVRDLPGYEVGFTLRPAGTVPGEVIGVVSVDRTPVTAGLTLQNLGSQEVGREAGLASIQFNGLTGAGSQTSLGLFASADLSEQKIVQLGHAMRVGGEGLTLSVDASYAVTKPTLQPRIPLHAETLIVTAQASYPLVRREARNLTLSAGLESIDQNVDFAESALSRDRLRVGFVRFDYNRMDPRATTGWTGVRRAMPRWRTSLRLEARQGVDLGASERCRIGRVCELSRADGDPNAFVLRGNALVEVRPLQGLFFSLAPSFQYAADPVLAFEEFSVGNFTVGRGYDPGAITGENGAGFRSEIGLDDLAVGPPGRLAVQPFAFFDYASVWNRNAFGPDFRDELYSTGGGLRVTLPGRARLEVVAAVPLRRAPLEDDRNLRVLISLSSSLLPWSL